MKIHKELASRLESCVTHHFKLLDLQEGGKNDAKEQISVYLSIYHMPNELYEEKKQIILFSFLAWIVYLYFSHTIIFSISSSYCKSLVSILTFFPSLIDEILAEQTTTYSFCKIIILFHNLIIKTSSNMSIFLSLNTKFS